jgi:hypothetical protein
MVEAGKYPDDYHAEVYIEYRFVRLACLACLVQHHRTAIHFYICSPPTRYTPTSQSIYTNPRRLALYIFQQSGLHSTRERHTHGLFATTPHWRLNADN